ncbi:MAG: hypothetical protein RLZZ511_1961 [Cyanobacteriota bacterium]
MLKALQVIWSRLAIEDQLDPAGICAELLVCLGESGGVDWDGGWGIGSIGL